MILLIYNQKMCREILLPNLRDSDYAISISGKAYGLRQDIRLLLEITGVTWKIKADETYQLRKSGIFCENVVLEEHEKLVIRTKRGEELELIVADSGLGFLTLGKYDFRQMSQISIGAAPQNEICYEFENLISSYHAEFQRHSDGWYVVDKSSNGIFGKNGRIGGTYRLNFGEHLNLFGLHIIFLGTMFAVGTYYGELKIDQERLKRYDFKNQENNIPSNKTDTEETDTYFNRSPRDFSSLYTDPVEIEGPPARKAAKQKPWFLVVGPSFTMAIPMLLGCGLAIWGSGMRGMASGAFMYTGLITAVGSSGLGAFWAVTNLKYAKQEESSEEERRFNAYSNYLIDITETIEKKYKYNADIMRKMYPEAQTCAGYDSSNIHLWNRNYTHEDFLFHRLGLGELPFQVKIDVPKEKFTMDTDTLIEKPQMIQKQFETLYQVPVGISLLKKQLIGLIGGGNKRGAIEIMYSIVAEIAASHCYTDVKFVFLYDEEEDDKKVWESMKWFPHVWSEDRQMRYMAADEVERRDVLFALSNILRARIQDIDNRKKRAIPKPYYLIFVSNPALLEGELLARYIYEPVPDYGITTFLMAQTVSQLPNTCEEMIQSDKTFEGYYNLQEGPMQRKPIRLDRVSNDSLEQMGRRLSGIKVNEIETTSEIPQSLDFFSMYGVRKLDDFMVEEHWKKNRTYNSMKALIGKKSGNADCYLDIHEKYHGPHGLIAGTTGSGKSETLQTYILSLALNFSPEDVSFFIIDFKGGGMANLFDGLPHMAGQISNLSGNQIRRAMISIKSENLRRQRIFTENGVNNINLYTRLYKNKEAQEPVPHLFIIIDEFAELKKEEPDFMRELISVAQVGRSLGVHLILATQKPSGTVDDNIWSNSRFRLCLRVQDRQDSNDMLHKPDAAFITQTGRGYLQVGSDEIYELFQSGWSGAPYEESEDGADVSVSMLTRTGKEALAASRLRRLRKEVNKRDTQEKTQLSAIVEYLKLKAEELGYQNARQLWMPVLEKNIVLSELETADRSALDKGEKWSLDAVVGLYDDPQNQQQKPLLVDFAQNGNLAVCGSVVTGKSIFMQTMLYSLFQKYNPDQLQCYILDFSSHLMTPFESAPNTGGIVYDNQEDRLGKFMHLLEKMMEERKKLFEGGNYAQYVRAYGQKIPAILVVIDNFGGFREKTRMKYDDIILKYVREGTGYGMYLAVTAAGYGMAEIPGRIADNIRTPICLEQSDRFRYMEILRTTKLPVFPEAGIPGRGLAEVDGKMLEFQTALSVQADDDFGRGRILEQFSKEKSVKWTGKRPLPIPEIPENPILGQLEKMENYSKLAEGRNHIPFAYELETAEVFSVGLRETYCYTISGRAHTGKTNVLKLLMYGAQKAGGKLCVIEPGQTELKKTAQECGAQYLTDTKTVFEYFKELTPTFVARNKKKRALIEAGADEERIYREMYSETPVYIFLSDLKEFFKLIYSADAEVGNMSGFMETIMAKGPLHRIYFFGCLKVEDAISLMSYKAYQSYISYKKGIHLGGNLSTQKIFNFQNIPYAELSKAMKKGFAYAADEEDETIGIQIVVPLARRENI